MAESNLIWTEAVRTLEAERPFALATVINVRGSTPRDPGAKMIVSEDRQIGTIGGGCGEAEVYRKARLLLSEGQGARLAEVDLTGDFDQQEIGTCGGIMEVLISLWSPQRDLPIARRLEDAATYGRTAALITLVESDAKSDLGAGAKVVIGPSDGLSSGNFVLSTAALHELEARAQNGVPSLLEIDSNGVLRPAVRLDTPGTKLFLDPISSAHRLIIAGAGHIAIPLATIGSMLGYHVTVIDDRASFANHERFPTADEIIVKPFDAAINGLKLDRYCYLISVTRGHAFDEETLRAALKQPCGFIGMIGSRRRVKATLLRFEEEGIDPQRLDEVHAPIGLDIGAETPEEIAVAIMAEIIRERRTGRRDEVTLGIKSGRLRRVD